MFLGSVRQMAQLGPPPSVEPALVVSAAVELKVIDNNYQGNDSF